MNVYFFISYFLLRQGFVEQVQKNILITKKSSKWIYELEVLSYKHSIYLSHATSKTKVNQTELILKY